MKAFEFFPYFARSTQSRIMLFVDGENLAIRYSHVLAETTPAAHIYYERNIYLWSEHINLICSCANVIRRYYYTSVKGDSDMLGRVIDQLKDLGIEAPRVFKRDKTRGSKQVDISLATDMLTHAHRKNYNIAVLIAGDEDYVPLVEAVQGEGCRVFLWFFQNGLNPKLRRIADQYNDITEILLAESSEGIL